ncbi:MAG: alkaline phytoceramidase [Flavobacteriales bacterium]|nr:alkaline phytoceramidase [Flavobacteriales bacterium]
MTIVNRYYRDFVLIIVFVLTAIVLYFLDPIAQDLAYHKFSDCRTFLGIPHFMDVISNIPFVIIGVMGMRLLGKAYRKKTMAYFLMSFTLFIGVILTGFGSAFYHYSPNNFTLIFDRLPMTLVFTAFFASIIYDYVDRRAGAWSFYGFLSLGIYSVIYWYYTEIIGVGDLRMYAFVQFFPIVAVPLILMFYKNNQLYTKQLLYVFGAYVMAKIFEYFDASIFEFLGFISGHTIKHLTSALAVYFIYQVYQKRILE